jgi:hypothetical protein
MEAVRMRAPNGKRFWARPGRNPWRSVADAVVGCILAAGLLIVPAVVPVPAVVAELFAVLAVVIVIATTDQLPAATRALRPASKAAQSEAVAELRSELAKLPETRHPLGL